LSWLLGVWGLGQVVDRSVSLWEPRSVTESAGDATARGWDFFISYTQVDQAWAEWISWQLETAGYRVLVQAWDFVPGANWIQSMQEGVTQAERTIAVLSEAYLESVFGGAEWQAVWGQDPTGQGRKLLMVRVADCHRPGLLAGVVSLPDLFDRPKAEAKERLLEGITAALVGRRKPAAAPPLPPSQRAIRQEVRFPGAVWDMPARNPAFTGRSDELAQLSSGFSARATVTVQSLHGMGGIGKTQLAIEYAHARAIDYTVAWWIQSEEPALLPDQFARLATDLDHPPVASDVDTVKAALHAGLGAADAWLLVFDNAETPTAVSDWLPTRPRLPGKPGHALVTTRRAGFGKLGRQVDLDVLDLEDCITLLRTRVPDIDDVIAGEIAEELGRLPLAIDQAAGYLTSTGTPAAEYLALFRERTHDMIAEGENAGREDGGTDGGGGREVTVATLWSLSLDRLTRDRPEAVELLDLCAYLAPVAIPLGLFTDHPDLLPGALAAAVRDKVLFNRVIAAIVGYSLAKRTPEGLHLHRLVQAAIRARYTSRFAGHLNDERSRTLEQTVARLLAAVRLGAPNDQSSWQMWAQIVPHLMSAPALANIDEDEALRRRLDDAGWYLFWRGDAAARRQLYEDSYRRRMLSLGPDHHDTLASAGGLAFAMNELGDHERALELQQEIYDRCRRVLGPDDRETLFAANGLAIFLNDSGEPERARELHEETLQRRLRLFPDDPDWLYSANRLAGVLREQGDIARAHDLFEETYEKCRRILGPDNIETLNVAGRGLAQVLDDLGEHDRARGLRYDIYNRCSRVFGSNHPVTVQLRRELDS
jgi:TIR domain/Tetratricopeptide repeat